MVIKSVYARFINDLVYRLFHKCSCSKSIQDDYFMYDLLDMYRLLLAIIAILKVRFDKRLRFNHLMSFVWDCNIIGIG